jgi:hypothetical protein
VGMTHKRSFTVFLTQPLPRTASHDVTQCQVFVGGVTGNTGIYFLSCGYVIWVSYGHRRVATRSAGAPTRYCAHECDARGAPPLPRPTSHDVVQCPQEQRVATPLKLGMHEYFVHA